MSSKRNLELDLGPLRTRESAAAEGLARLGRAVGETVARAVDGLGRGAPSRGELESRVEALLGRASRARAAEEEGECRRVVEAARERAERALHGAELSPAFLQFLSAPARTAAKPKAAGRQNFYARLVAQLREERTAELRRLRRKAERKRLEELQLAERQAEVARAQQSFAESVHRDYLGAYAREVAERRAAEAAAEAARLARLRAARLQALRRQQLKDRVWRRLKLTVLMLHVLRKGGRSFRERLRLEKKSRDQTARADLAAKLAPLAGLVRERLGPALAAAARALNTAQLNVVEDESLLRSYELSLQPPKALAANARQVRQLVGQLFAAVRGFCEERAGAEAVVRTAGELLQEKRFPPGEFYPADVLARLSIDGYGRVGRLRAQAVRIHLAHLLFSWALCFEGLEAVRELPRGASRAARFAFRVLLSLVQHVLRGWADRLVTADPANQKHLPAELQTPAMPPRRCDPQAVLPKAAAAKLPPAYLDQLDAAQLAAFFAAEPMKEFFAQIDAAVDLLEPAMGEFYQRLVPEKARLRRQATRAEGEPA